MSRHVLWKGSPWWPVQLFMLLLDRLHFLYCSSCCYRPQGFDLAVRAGSVGWVRCTSWSQTLPQTEIGYLRIERKAHNVTILKLCISILVLSSVLWVLREILENAFYLDFFFSFLRDKERRKCHFGVPTICLCWYLGGDQVFSESLCKVITEEILSTKMWAWIYPRTIFCFTPIYISSSRSFDWVKFGMGVVDNVNHVKNISQVN